jgi:hypothetical protein
MLDASIVWEVSFGDRGLLVGVRVLIDSGAVPQILSLLIIPIHGQNQLVT